MKNFAHLITVRLQPLKLSIAVLLFATVIVGCNKNQPSCVDDSAISLVKQIVEESLQKEVGNDGGDTVLLDRVKKRIQIAVTTIRTSNKDEKIGKVTCDASLEITLANVGQIVDDPIFKTLQNAMPTPATIDTTGPVWKTDIQYTAQNTEDTKDLLVEMSGHNLMVSLLATLAHSGVMDPKLAPGELPADLLASGDAGEATVRLMNQVYGKQEQKDGCWMFQFEDMPYCMKVVQYEIKTLESGKRLYAIANGQAIDKNGETLTTHAMPGLVGAFIAGESNGKVAFISQAKNIQAGTMGTAPSDWALVQLGANDNWGWQGTYGDCHQGYCGTRMVVLANQSGAVHEVGLVPTEYDDTGACAEDTCLDSSTLKSTVSVGKLPQNAEFFDLLVTVSGTGDGKPVEPKTWTLPFNKAKRTYDAPADWPLGNRDF